MNEDEATGMLAHLGEQVPVGAAPVDATLEQAKGNSRRRRAIQVGSAVAAVAVVAVGAFVVQPSIGGSGNLTTQPTTSASGRAVPTEQDLLGQWHAVGDLEEQLTNARFSGRSMALSFSQSDERFEWESDDGCNSLAGRFEVSADGEFSTSHVIQSDVACPSVERDVVTVPDVVTKASQVRLVDGKLRLYDEDSLLATFVRGRSTTETVQVLTEVDLLGQWRAVGDLEEQLVSAGFPYKSRVLEFSQREGKFWWGGREYCNSTGARFDIGTDGALSIFHGASTLIHCPRERLDVVTVPDVMTKATQVRLVGGQLRLYEEKSLLATFVRVPSGKSGVEPDNSGQEAVSLTCPSDMRGISAWEATHPVRETPEELASVFVDPSAGEEAVVTSINGDSATAYILRRNGTARAELALFGDAQGWRLGTSETCANGQVRLDPPMANKEMPRVPGSTPIPLSTSSWRPGDGAMRAIVGGGIALSKDGCVYFKTAGVETDVIWPAGYSADISPDGILTVRNPSGEPVGHEGARISASGGDLSGDEGGIPDAMLRSLECHVSDSVVIVQDVLPPLSAPTTPAESLRLDCKKAERVHAVVTLDGPPAPGTSIAEALESEGSYVVTQRTPRKAVAFLVRPDGTASTQVHLRKWNGGWLGHDYVTCEK